MSTFGNTLKKLRKDRKISQRNLAEKVGIDFSYISKIETGVLPPPSAKIIADMAKVLEVDPEELILLANKVPQTLKKTIVDDNLAAAFLRKMPSLTDEKRKKLQELIDED